MDDPLALSHFAPIGMVLLLLAIGANLPRRFRILRRTLLVISPLILCTALFDRGYGAGFRWSMYFLVSPAVVLVAGQLIWRGRWTRGRRSFTFLTLLAISATYLILIPPIFFEMPDTSGPGTRWIVWLFALVVMGISGSFYLLLRGAGIDRTRDRY
ncbi:MAG: hypothetical protein ABIO39_08430 [Caulobacteraceae bacterium]